MMLIRDAAGSKMVQLRLEVATEEMARIKLGEAATHSMSPFAFLQLGLDLEEQQYVLIYAILRPD
jgi:hypothetical protein